MTDRPQLSNRERDRQAAVTSLLKRYRHEVEIEAKEEASLTMHKARVIISTTTTKRQGKRSK